MESYSRAAVERAMKVQEVILQAMAKKKTWYQAAEIIGISDRHMRRWRERYEEGGFRALFDRRRGRPSPKRVPMALGLCAFMDLWSFRISWTLRLSIDCAI